MVPVSVKSPAWMSTSPAGKCSIRCFPCVSLMHTKRMRGPHDDVGTAADPDPDALRVPRSSLALPFASRASHGAQLSAAPRGPEGGNIGGVAAKARDVVLPKVRRLAVPSSGHPPPVAWLECVAARHGVKGEGKGAETLV